MFETRNDLKDKLAAAEAEITRLEGEIAQAQTAAQESVNLSQKVAELTEDLAELQTSEAAKIAELETANASIETLTAELETEKAKTTPEAIQALALAALAEAGQPAPLAGSEEEEPKGHLETFQSLKGTAATDYFKKHKAEIMAEINKQK